MSYAGDISPEQAWQMLEQDPEAILVDVRTQAEWNYVGVPDISSLGKRTVFVEWVGFPTGGRNADFLNDLAAAGVKPGQPIAFLCRSGHRSIGSAQLATSAGLGPAYNVLDGFEGGLDENGHRGSTGWRALGLPWRQS
ncbi:rhodanese-like domain-containing protein [Hoyosella rhizosphaerae]|uniref:rhodanese-like domain-containing protein n=1 Tax=Hoyosella rhizosphaerae TaxID=1755582 RepID=UPI0016635388|nr:rhodanese-like domain-containing protein [Hoyosella rhizosphaerae]MBN4927746.1 rhodanese-like domain-containing protein [Hoyosella rhizosphaerae]